MSWNPDSGQNSDDAGSYGSYRGYTGSSQSQASSYSSGNNSYDASGPQSYGDYTANQQQQQQEYTTYQPPRSALRGGRYTGSGNPTSLGLDGKLEAAISYALWWITGIIFFVIERKNRFVRFNAAQSILVFGSVSLLYTLLQLPAHLPFLGWILAPVFGCVSSLLLVAAGVAWLFLMVQSYRGVTVKLPYFGSAAEWMVKVTSRKGSA